MATDLQTSSESGVASLLSGILSDTQELIQQQMALFKTEVRNDVRRSMQATLLLAAGGIVALVGAVLLCVTAVHVLHAYTALYLWACYGIVGGVITLAGAALIIFGREKFLSFNPLPDESVAALKENLGWKTTLK